MDIVTEEFLLNKIICFRHSNGFVKEAFGII